MAANCKVLTVGHFVGVNDHRNAICNNLHIIFVESLPSRSGLVLKQRLFKALQHLIFLTYKNR